MPNRNSRHIPTNIEPNGAILNESGAVEGYAEDAHEAGRRFEFHADTTQDGSVPVPSGGNDVSTRKESIRPAEVNAKNLYVTREMIEKHGHTIGCKGCDYIRGKTKYKTGHSDECRFRLIGIAQNNENESELSGRHKSPYLYCK